MVSDHTVPGMEWPLLDPEADAKLRATLGAAANDVFDFVASMMPPWWVWPILTVIAFLAAWRIRILSLRSLEVAAPTDQERSRAHKVGQAIAARGTIGLVLGGGGAKGAYEIGCWKALRECGIEHFGAIAGTSVGALNAVLVAQDDYGRAEAIWHDMSFGRVLKLNWLVLLALAIRLILLVPYLGKYLFPARAIPVALWRAVHSYHDGMAKDGDPRHLIRAALELYRAFFSSPRSPEVVSNLVLYGILLLGLSVWWVLAAPVLALVAIIFVAPFIALLVVAYAAAFATLLDQLSTRLVLASNEPLHQLLRECVDVGRLRALQKPLYVTLGSLREVTRRTTFIQTRAAARTVTLPVDAVAPSATKPPAKRSWWQRNVIGDAADSDYAIGQATSIVVDGNPTNVDPASGLITSSSTTIEYVPTHFDVRAKDSDRMRELILQSAGLPEIFPARMFDGVTYVDGGIADNEPLAAIASLPNHALIIVIPLDHRTGEAKVRDQLATNFERLNRPQAEDLPEILVLTPSRSLGNMVTGTLDFKAERARVLMRLGYRDTIMRLAAQS